MPATAEAEAKRATVHLATLRPNLEATHGAGFLVREDLVVTSSFALGMEDRDTPPPSHIFARSLSNAGDQRARGARGKVIAFDPERRIAFVRLDAPIPETATLTLHPAPPVSKDAKVLIFGLPLDGKRAAHSSHVAIRSGTILDPGGRDPSQPLTLAAPVDRRDDGAALLDPKGRLLGLVRVSRNAPFTRDVVSGRLLGACMSGWPVRLVLHGMEASAEGFSAQVGVTLVDPTHALTSGRLEVWSQDAGEAGRRHALRSVNLVREAARDQFVCHLRADVRAGRSLWARAVLTSESGVEQSTPAQQLLSSSALTPRTKPLDAPHLARPAPPLRATHKLSSGLAYDQVESEVKFVSLGDAVAPVVALVPAPAGEEVYALLQGLSKVLVCDPVSLEVVSSISVPRAPVAIWCDAQDLLVACSLERRLLTIERRTRRVVHSLSFPQRPELVPKWILGRTEGGDTLSVWEVPGLRSGVLFSQGPTGLVTELGQESLHDAFANLDSQRALFQAGRPFDDMLGSGFVTRDRRHKVLNHHRQGHHSELATRPEASPLLDFPGTALAEIPGEPILVFWQRTGRERVESREFSYVGRHDGRLLRQILATEPRAQRTPAAYQELGSNAIFVPQTERLVFWSRSGGRDTRLRVIPCGPVRDSVQPTRVAIAINDPPTKLKIGTSLSFTPEFTCPTPGATVEFALESTPYGARIDPLTGTLSWTPTEIMAGRWDLGVVATVNGARVPVLHWTVEVGE